MHAQVANVRAQATVCTRVQVRSATNSQGSWWVLADGGCLQSKAPPADKGGQITLIHGPQLCHDIYRILLRFLRGAAAAAGHTELVALSALFFPKTHTQSSRR